MYSENRKGRKERERERISYMDIIMLHQHPLSASQNYIALKYVYIHVHSNLESRESTQYFLNIQMSHHDNHYSTQNDTYMYMYSVL